MAEERIVKVKNNKDEADSWTGKRIQPGEYYQIPIQNLSIWYSDDKVFSDISNHNLVVSDGSKDFTVPNEGYRWLVGNLGRTMDPNTEKFSVHSSSRPIVNKKLATYFIGTPDTSDEFLGSENPVILHLTSSDSSKIQELNFNSVFGDVYMNEVYVLWENAEVGDYFSILIVSDPTPLSTDSSQVSLDYELDNNRVKPASGGTGNGTHGFAGKPVLVKKWQEDGYWDLDKHNNLVANTNISGQFDIYNQKMLVDFALSKIPVFGTSHRYNQFSTHDTSLLPYGHKLRIEAVNHSGNDWTIGFFGTFYREPPAPKPL